MAEIVIKGFVAKIDNTPVGEKKIERTRLLVVDETRSANVAFNVDFWRENAKLVADIVKGNVVLVKAYVDDASYTRTENGKDVKHYMLAYTGFAVKKCERDTPDLGKEFDDVGAGNA